MGKGYYYFETPDYDNCAGKVWWATKYAVGLSASYSTFECIAVNEPKTALLISQKFARYVIPWTSSLMLGSSVACALSNLRGKKDDCWNYFWAGALTGIIWTKFFKCSGHGAAAGFGSAMAGFMFKKAHQEDWVLIPDHIEGSGAYGGAGGFDNWGDLRIPGIIWEDPGRRPL